MATLHDVARHAGVSPMTVSRVVNGTGPVSPERRARVEQALADVGYMPNAVARNLRTKRSDTVGLVLPDMTNPFFTTLAQGVETALREAGISLLLTNTDEREEEERRIVPVLLQHQVDGLLIVPATDGTEAVRLCRDQGVPVVLVDRPPGVHDVDVVRSDAETGSLDLGRLLVSLGHRHAAVLTGPAAVRTAVDRATGFTRAFDEAGLPAPVVEHGRFSIESGVAMARGAMARDPRPTALFAANNFIAIGVMHALDDLGLRVPEDVALVGFDDLPSAMITFPFFTVAAQPAFEMGRRAVAVLLERQASPDAPARDVVFTTELVIRRSSGDHVGDAAAP
ncbi:MAG TPA: LacI family DNA-binding transcriptional regulator [Candidatus Limnocylindrales bacterium]|nr:LacI family DNA-binding transcriptional regulator [Candidatus Limnocylindrales bacterium]